MADERWQPFNAFLSGFSATVGQFVLTASLRMQTNPENKSEFGSISHERYIFVETTSREVVTAANMFPTGRSQTSCLAA